MKLEAESYLLFSILDTFLIEMKHNRARIGQKNVNKIRANE